LQRAFGAVLLSQYRRKIAQNNKLNIKPVILLKSKQIAESQNFKQVFHAFIDDLSVQTLDDAKNTIGNYAPFNKIFSFLESENIDFNNFMIELKNDFDRNKSLDINDTSELINNQILVNSLEDKNNEIRVIFAVDKLNEGWDVLNLFDIVRLYDTRDGGKTTTQEAQLIGRGARYCPFVYNTDNADNTAPDMRKLDSDINNDLRILESV
jgi:type III restriction enzyme